MSKPSPPKGKVAKAGGPRTEIIYYDGAWRVTTDVAKALRAVEVSYDTDDHVVRRRPINLKKFATLSTDPRARAVMLGQDHH